MNKAIYPGTFDPITEGHLDIILRAASLFDELMVLIMHNPAKNCTISEEERLRLIKKCIEGHPNIKAEIGEGLTVTYARNNGYQAIVRGIRAVTDYEYELALATGNMALDNSVETVLLVSRPELSFLSSSIVKEIAKYKGDISKFIPAVILEDVKRFLGYEK